MSGAADSSVPPISDATERCGNFASCGALVSRSAAGAGGCGGCRNAVYCGGACQRAHWPAHKAHCQEFQRANAKAASAVPTLTSALPPFGPTLAAARAGDAGAQYVVGLAYKRAPAWRSCGHPRSNGTRGARRSPSRPARCGGALGDCYRFGNGVAADAAEAVRLYRVGADAGEAYAQCKLANCLTYAVGFPAPDVHAAFALYTAAAAQDYPTAILNLGACYFNGKGVKRDAPRAVVLWRRALAHSKAISSVVTVAAFSLGAAYWNGDDGLPRDLELGARYWRQAAAGGHETAARLLAECGVA